MIAQSKVLVLPNVCGVEIDLSGVAVPSIDTSLQPFYNSIVQNAAPNKVYASPGKIRIQEKSKDSRSGQIFEQELQLQFPATDPLRAVRIEEYLKAKYLYVTLSNGMVFFFGRNDYYLNTVPKVSTNSNEKTTIVSYSTRSIFPFGFTNGSFDFNLPEDIPVNFYNL